jgi:AAA domain/DnaB-like helicase N terminal domain
MKPRPREFQDEPPHSVEAEQGILSSMLQRHGGSEAIAEAMAKIRADHFFVPAYQTIFTAICDQWDSGQAVDLITLTQSLRDKNLLDSVGGAGPITNLATFVPTAANVDYYLGIVRDKYARREVIAACAEATRRLYNEQDDDLSSLDALASKADSIRSLLGRNGALPSIEDAAELVRLPLELPEDVIEGILHRAAKMVLGGASKSFKTWTLIDLAVSVATGADWFSGYPTKRGRVLYINLELPSGWFTKRIRTVCDERQLTLESGYLKVWNLRGYAADLSKLLSPLLRGIGRDEFVLIIIDPVYKLLGARDENKAGDIASLLNEIEMLAVKTGAAVAFGAHYSKGNQSAKESIDRIGGSGVFARDPDSILNFTRHEQDDCFTVEMTLRNHPPQKPFVVKWEYPIFTIENLLDPTELKRPGPGRPEKYDAKDLLTLIDEPMSGSQIAKKAWSKFKIRERRVYELLTELKDCGLLNQPKKRGLYDLP